MNEDDKNETDSLLTNTVASTYDTNAIRIRNEQDAHDGDDDDGDDDHTETHSVFTNMAETVSEVIHESMEVVAEVAHEVKDAVVEAAEVVEHVVVDIGEELQTTIVEILAPEDEEELPAEDEGTAVFGVTGKLLASTTTKTTTTLSNTHALLVCRHYDSI